MNRFVAGAVVGVALMTAGRVAAADSGIMITKAPPTKAPAPAAAYDWTGIYIGGHLGYATGWSNWSATQGGGTAPSLNGSLDFFEAYDGFEGTGSYALGLQAGYDYMFPSRLVLGVEADVSFPNTLSGSQAISSSLIGQASYQDQVEFSGTVRGRIGYAPGNWLFYATGGFAYSYDQFTRTQLSGTPAGGSVQPGSTETLFMEPRVGGAVGAGVELALTPNWIARLEYLYTGYASRAVDFPAAAQRFDSDLAVQSLRLGLDYRLGRSGIDSAYFHQGAVGARPRLVRRSCPDDVCRQYAAPFRAPYRGQNSLDPNAGRESWGHHGFAGVKLWQGAELWIDPELGQGFGLERYRRCRRLRQRGCIQNRIVGALSRVSNELSSGRRSISAARDQKVDADQNQFAGSQTANRLVITAGKFSVSDVFDSNKYAQNPRKDFLNWALIDTGSFDYAADAWGYTYGAAAEWYQGNWTLRGGLFRSVGRSEQCRAGSELRPISVDRRNRAPLPTLGASR